MIAAEVLAVAGLAVVLLGLAPHPGGCWPVGGSTPGNRLNLDRAAMDPPP